MRHFDLFSRLAGMILLEFVVSSSPLYGQHTDGEVLRSIERELSADNGTRDAYVSRTALLQELAAQNPGSNLGLRARWIICSYARTHEEIASANTLIGDALQIPAVSESDTLSASWLHLGASLMHQLLENDEEIHAKSSEEQPNDAHTSTITL